jgi:hypothetical protein
VASRVLTANHRDCACRAAAVLLAARLLPSADWAAVSWVPSVAWMAAMLDSKSVSPEREIRFSA